MARTVAEIKQEIGNAYITQPEIRDKYALTDADIANGFDATFSKVSVESMLFYSVAMAIYVMERTMELFKTEIERKIQQSYIASYAWWHARALEFQLGDTLLLNPQTFVYAYPTTNPTKQVVKRCAVRELITPQGVTQLNIYVNGNNGALTTSELDLFSNYCARIKPAGVLINTISEPAVQIGFDISIKYNPLLLTIDGKLIGSTTQQPVLNTLQSFIDTLTRTNFGGSINITKLTDALQHTDGVEDVYINKVYKNGIQEAASWGDFVSQSGWFVLDETNTNIHYTARNQY